jgi:hypothetical protein
MTSVGVVVNNSIKCEPPAVKAEDFYGFVWNRIKELAPRATLLRGAAHLNPVQASGGGDLDILVPTDLAPVRAFLIDQGFHRAYKPQPYIERFRLKREGDPDAYTIDLHKVERWGLGFRRARNGNGPAHPHLACLLHAVVDGKGTAYFEKEQTGPPWQFDNPPIATFGPLGRALWRSGYLRLLTLHLLLRGVIRPDPVMILRSLARRVVFRGLQLRRKMGLEVALLGVDGTGKSSLASALLRLPAPVKAVYMGPHDYATRIMRWVDRHHVPLLLRQLAYRYDLLVRRLYGCLLARRGWIVVYDRHPAERLDPRQKSLGRRIKNLVDHLYAWPVDLTFWLTGDYSALYQRKKEYTTAELRVIDERFQSLLQHYRVPFEKIDVTQNDLNAVQNIVCGRVLAEHQKRISLEGLPRMLRAILT